MPSARPVTADHMLIFIGTAVVAIAAALIPGTRLLPGSKYANLGRMSRQWIVEHRASHAV
jgi:hypothetical protein